MKRHPDGDETATKRPHWQPVISCQLCRGRKLKCDRQRPCSNCASRGLACVYNEVPSANVGISRDGESSKHICDRDCSNLHRRLEKIESLLYFNPPFIQSRRSPAHNELLRTSSNVEEEPELGSTPKLLEKIVTTPNSAFPCGSVRNPGTRENTSSEQPLHLPTFRLHSSFPSNRPNHMDYFPPKDLAFHMLEEYAENENHLYRLIHMPSARDTLLGVYSETLASGRCDSSALALFFAIFASTKYFHNLSRGKPSEHKQQEATRCCELWSSICLDLLFKDGQALSPSLAALQTVATIGHIFVNADGHSVTLAFIFQQGISLARSMLLHHTDTDNSRRWRKHDRATMIDVELRRRLWWHVAVSDWILASMGGPQEGIYTVQARQMRVDYPSNVDDENITGSADEYNLPLSEPTSMSYFIQRVKVGEMWRDIFDALPSVDEPQSLDYSIILGLHDRLQACLKALPSFYQLDARSVRASDPVYNQRPYLVWQRNLINFNFHMNLCRLHRPFLLLGSREPRYAFSRMACIRSAHTMLELRQTMEADSSQSIPQFAQLYYVSHHVLSAAVLLAVDLCVNQDEPRAEQRKNEILSACRLLEKMQENFMISRKGVQSAIEKLRKMLARYKERMPNPALDRSSAKPTSAHALVTTNPPADPLTSLPQFGEVHMVSTDMSATVPNLDTEVANFDNMWAEFFDIGPNFDLQDWDSFMLDLDLQPS